MADKKFFHTADPADLRAIATLTGARLDASAAELVIHDVAPLDRATASDISFLDNTKYLDMFAASKAGACFVRAKFAARAPKGMTLLITEEPYCAFAVTASHLYPEAAFVPAVSAGAQIAESARLGKNARIDSGAVIGERVTLGDGCWIGANSVIEGGVEIGARSRIGALCAISHAIIGTHAIIHPGVHIGQDGFGFAPGPRGILKVPQLGRVIIGDHVEIGSGTCIDRGAGPDTSIGDHSKIDNLVQIGHNVTIGRHVVIAAQCGIAGSARIEDGVMLGGQVGISGHITIGAKAKIAARGAVMTDVPAGATYGGAPAIPVKDWHRQTIAVAQMAKKKE